MISREGISKIVLFTRYVFAYDVEVIGAFVVHMVWRKLCQMFTEHLWTI